ncbi:MAG TPA: hypothetical protein VFP85_06470 [Vicinamibacterales bacterium]|nr:hypothetical protein [Vicinamibacterales bacterium]
MKPAVVFWAVLCSLVGSTYLAWLTVPGLTGRIRHISVAQRPLGDDYYLAHDRGGHLDHHVLYYGTDAEAMRHLKAADILFVGTSRMMFAIRSRVFTPWAAAHGVTYYTLGFGHRDGDTWVREIIRRHDLRPKLVVANVDGFFGRALSEWAERVRKDSTFGARKLMLEGEFGHESRRVIHRVIPNWIDLYGRPGFPFGNEFIAYRSRTTGVWSISPWPDPVMEAPSLDYGVGPVGPRIGDPARAFKAELDAIGAKLVLTYVPTPDDAGGNPVALGTMLGVPVVGMDVDGLTSHDGSHLSEESAMFWSRRLAQDLRPYLPGAR